MSRPSVAVQALLCCLLAGCALLSKTQPLEVRYFEAVEKPASEASGAQAGQPLRLGQVKAAHHLDKRIVSRRGTHELSYYELLRWTERPEEYLRRALLRGLYEQAGFTRVISGAAPTLEVELIAFEEREQNGRRLGRIELQAQLHDERVQLLQETVSIETQVDESKGDRAEALVAALGEALGLAAKRVNERTRQVLAARSP